jgi:hypothetical protein
MPDPGQAQPTPQPQQPQAPPSVSDKTIDAFMAVDDNKKRDALAKMSEPTKQALLTGIKARKGGGQPQASILPTPKQPQPGVTQGTPLSFTSAGSSSIGPSTPTYLQREKEKFTQGAPTASLLGRQSSATNQPNDKPISLIKFEAGMTPKEREKHPIVTGIQEILSSMTSPENLALMAGSGGMGELPGLAKATLPRLVSGYFTAQMLLGAYKEIPEFRQALDTGNDSEAKRIMTHIVGGIALAGLAARHAIKGESPSSAPGNLLNSGIDVLKKRAIVAASSHEVLKKDTDTFKNTIADSYKTAKDQGVGKLVQNIVKADQLDSQSKGLSGSTHAGNIDKVIDGIVKAKGAGDNYNDATVELPGTKIIKDAIKLKVDKKGPLLSWDDLKDINQAAEFAKQAAYGKDAAVVGDFTAKLRSVMRGRAAQLGPDRLADHDEYVQTMKDLSTHKDGILTKLNNADTPLKFMNELGKESNRPDLDRLFKTLEKHGGLPSDYMDKFLADHKLITHFANASEGDTKLSKLTNRLIAMKSHKVAGTLGLTAGATVGHLVGTATGIPLMPTFVGASFTAAFMADLMDKYNAAQQIREIGGPSGVTGNRPIPSSPSGASPQQGPGGGGLSPSPTRPPGNMPSGSPPSGSSVPVDTSNISPALAKLLKPAEEVGGREAKGADEPKVTSETGGSIHDQETETESQKQSRLTEVKKRIKNEVERARSIKAGADDPRPSFLVGVREHLEAQLLDPSISEKEKIGIRDAIERVKERERPFYEAADKAKTSETKTEPKVTKAPPEARGRVPSKRKGMTKDSPEARNAKAAEHIAEKRASGELATESSGENVAGKAAISIEKARLQQGKSLPEDLLNLDVRTIEDQFSQTWVDGGKDGKFVLNAMKKAKKIEEWDDYTYKQAMLDGIVKEKTRQISKK